MYISSIFKSYIISAFLLFAHSAIFTQIYINEILASNASTNYDPDKTQFVDWIEIYNPGNTGINLGGYFLTDDSLQPQKYQLSSTTYIGAHSYQIFWADGLDYGRHTNFKLTKGGEFVGIYAPSGEKLDGIAFPPQSTDISYGRNIDNSEQWGFYYYPSPNAENSTPFYTEIWRTDPPVFSVNGGIFQNSFLLTLSTTPGCTIHYTTDGSVPVESSPQYVSPINIDSTINIRAKSFSSTLMPSITLTNTYLIGVDHDIPVVSITTDPKNLFGDTIGIYCTGTNGTSGFGGEIANYWHRDWERPANIEIFESNNEQVINQIGDIAINGARRSMAQKSFRLFARNKYGNPTFDYPVFQDAEVDHFQSLILRNGGIPDFKNSLIRDNLVQELVRNKTDIDIQYSRMAVVYLNGKYWGIYSIKEKQNEKYLVSHHKINPNNIDYLQNQQASVIEGSQTDYHYIMNTMRNTNPDSLTQFLYDKLDIDEYVDYLITEIYTGNIDWPMINIKFWHEKTERSKWRWVLFDTDPCFGLWGSYSTNSIHNALDTTHAGWPNPPQSTEFARLVLKNNTVLNQFVQSFAAHASSTFKAQRIIDFATAMKTEIENEIPAHIELWKDSISPDGTCIQSVEEWHQTFDQIALYANNRWNSIRQDVIEELDLSGDYYLTTNTTNGKIKVYAVELDTAYQSNQFFSGVPILFTAIPDLGYRFSHWSGASNSTNPQIKKTFSEDTELTAVFVPDDRSVLPLTVTGLDTLFYAQSPYIGYDHLTIENNGSLFIEAGVEIYMPQDKNIYVYGQLNIDGSEELPVKIDVNKETGAKQWGVLYFENTASASTLNYVSIQNTSTGTEPAIQKAAISAFGSDLICDHLIISGCYQPMYSEYGNIFIKNSKLSCHYTCDNINVKYADTAIIENCEFAGSNAPDTDGIDLDAVSYGIIRNNVIYGFNGFNCDGIDIGESASNIFIENNKIYNCSDKGVSVGQGSIVFLKNNLIYNCNMGVGVKDFSSTANIDKNTFYNNDYGVACFEKNYNDGGGNAQIKNTIISGSRISSVFVDALSSVEISYSCSDTDSLEGMHNILNDPLFEDLLSMKFSLANNSPCIDAGDPGSPLDEDGSITDMGAVFNASLSIDTNIVINEINYHSDSLTDSGDWVELYNKTSQNIDMSGWSFMDNDKDHFFLFPEGFQLKAKHFIVLCSDTSKFIQIHPDITNFRGNLGFGFSNSGEMLRLYTGSMNLADYVEYDDDSPWDNDADGEGPTLELINPFYDNALSDSWTADTYQGSPGKSNGFIDGVVIDNTNTTKVIYPNPAHSSFQITNITSATMKIYNLQGQLIKTGKISNNSPIDISGLQTGFYLVEITTDKEQFPLKLIVQ
jgi:LEA14-like dessication related protein